MQVVFYCNKDNLILQMIFQASYLAVLRFFFFLKKKLIQASRCSGLILKKDYIH